MNDGITGQLLNHSIWPVENPTENYIVINAEGFYLSFNKEIWPLAVNLLLVIDIGYQFNFLVLIYDSFFFF